MTVSVSESFPILTVSSLSRSLAFYRDVLGGVVEYSFPEDEPAFVTLRLGDAQLGLGAGAAAPTPGFALCVYVPDVDSAAAAMVDAGGSLVEEPSDQPYGERMARVADPDGYGLVVVAPL